MTATRALQQANGDANAAVRLYPWFGEPCETPSGPYPRRIDTPYWRVQLEALNTPLPKIGGKGGFVAGEDQW